MRKVFISFMLLLGVTLQVAAQMPKDIMKDLEGQTLIIYGDVNGDGKIAATDYVAIKNHIMDQKKLTDFEKLCADVNRDGKVAATDYVAIKNHIMDVKKISQ